MWDVCVKVAVKERLVTAAKHILVFYRKIDHDTCRGAPDGERFLSSAESGTQRRDKQTAVHWLKGNDNVKGRANSDVFNVKLSTLNLPHGTATHRLVRSSTIGGD
jgi:hypothetical protein